MTGLSPQFGSFDSILLSSKLLFEMSLLEGWDVVMDAVMATRPDALYVQGTAFSSPPLWRQPMEPWRVPAAARGDGTANAANLGANPSQRVAAAAFCILWILFGCFVALNMFFGVIADTWNRIRSEGSGYAFMTEEQVNFIEASKIIVHETRPLGPLSLSKNTWLGQILAPLTSAMKNSNVGRTLRGIMLSLRKSCTQLASLGLLLAFALTFFALLFVHHFSYINYTPERSSAAYSASDFHWSHGTNWGDHINRHANFQTFGRSMLVLVGVALTGEGFNDIMYDAHGYAWGHNRLTCCPQCGPVLPNPSTGRLTPQSSCGNSAVAFVIYAAFLFVMFILVTLIIGVFGEPFASICDSTASLHASWTRHRGGPVIIGPVTPDDIEDFREAWRKYDPSGTSLIASRDVLPLLQQVKWPLGLAGRAAEWSAENPDKTMMWLGALDIPDHGGYALFHEVLLAVALIPIGCEPFGVEVPICDSTMQLARSFEERTAASAAKLPPPTHNVCGVSPYEKKGRRA